MLNEHPLAPALSDMAYQSLQITSAQNLSLNYEYIVSCSNLIKELDGFEIFSSEVADIYYERSLDYLQCLVCDFLITIHNLVEDVFILHVTQTL